MQINAVSIWNYRSIAESSLQQCGPFNVLIGKNNSGKSTIFSAIEAFFDIIRKKEIVSLEPMIGREIDFHKRDAKKPISIAITFTLSQEERSTLIQNIGSEKPQLKNAIDGFDATLDLRVQINFKSTPRCAYVHKISLIEKGHAQTERLLLVIDDAAALELQGLARKLRSSKREAESLNAIVNRIDRTDWSALKERSDQRAFRSPLAYMFGERLGANLSPSTQTAVEKMFSESSSYDGFRNAVKDLLDDYDRQARDLGGKPLSAKVRTFSGDEQQIPAYITALLDRIADLKILHLKERRKEIGSDEAQRLLALKVRRGGPEVLRSIQETVLALLGVQLDAFAASDVARGRSEDRTAELDVDNFLVEVNGSGIREALRLILDTEFERPNVLLVEEPEIHLHPALETSVMRFLIAASSKAQIFITTHSTNFLDSGESQNIFFISKNGATSVQRLSFQDAGDILPRDLGLRLSSLFMYDRLVFVEGPTDEKILREWSTTLGVNLSQRNVGFLPMMGSGNLKYYAAQQVLTLLAKRNVKTWFLLDRDGKSELDEARIKKTLGANGKILLLSKREIENYLLVPRVLAAYIRARKGNPEAEGLDEYKLRQDISECVEPLKSVTIWNILAARLVRPIYPSRDEEGDDSKDASPDRAKKRLSSMASKADEMMKAVDSVFEEVTQDVNKRWAAEKLDIVPGATLLDTVMKKYGLAYSKVRDGAKLASLMSGDEIVGDVRTFIEELGKI